MKTGLLTVLLCAILAVPAVHAGLLDISGLTELAAEKAKETKAVYSISFKGTQGGSLYLPIYVLHAKKQKDKPRVDYLDLGIGGGIQEGGKTEIFFPAMFNIVAIPARLWRTQWRKDHIYLTPLPPIFIGPIFAPDLTKGPKHWVIGDVACVGISISLGE